MAPVIKNPHDVYFGRGRGFFDKPGTKAWRGMIEDNRERYELVANSSKDKTSVALELVNEVRKKNGKFLILDHKDGNKLKELDNKEAIKRCKQSFANLKCRTKEDLDVQEVLSGTGMMNNEAYIELDASEEATKAMATILNSVEETLLPR